MTKEQMDAIWRAPGVQNAGHLNLWTRDEHGRPYAKPGARRVPAWDKALLRRARRDLPKWHEGWKKGVSDMNMEYTIDELALLPGCAAYVYGVADVNYTIAPADPNSGIFRPHIEDLCITGIALDGIELSDPGRQLDSTEPLYKLIEAALYRDDALTQACLEHYEGGGAWDE